jgi:hypothetical protein
MLNKDMCWKKFEACTIHHKSTDSEAIDLRFTKGANYEDQSLFEINVDPTKEIDEDFYLKCTLDGETITTNDFRVKVKCPNNIQIFEPAGSYHD